MATASKIQLTTSQKPEYYCPGIQEGSTRRTTDLLQTNHDNHHIFFNNDGFHNHIVHHLLTIWALGAAPEEIQQGFDVNESYQKPPGPLNSNIVRDLSDPEKYTSYLGEGKYYHEFLVFFRSEIDRCGWQEAMQKFLLASDERADDMLARCWGGFLHPLIHLGFAVEAMQPAIVAEALAQTAVHGNYMRKLLVPAEEAARKRDSVPSKHIVHLLDDIHADKELREAPRWSDGNKLRDGIIGRASDRMLDYVSQYRVQPDELEKRTAEMVNSAAYFTAGAQRPSKAIKYDFYFMHCVNCSIFFSTFLRQDWITDENKVRLLCWKVWNDLAMYASRKSPDIRLDEIRNYKPREPSGWDDIINRVCRLQDDGHASKLVRALAHGQQICEPYEDLEEFRIKHSDWLQMGHMAIDSVEATGSNWVRSAGFDEAWKDIPARAQL